MCIICNVPNPFMHGAPSDPAGEYLIEYARSQHHMRVAAAHMLECSKTAHHLDDRKRYDASYKAMKRLMRQWNSLEHFREKGDTSKETEKRP